MIFKYNNKIYPDYIKQGNASAFIVPAASHFCKGAGVDIGGGKWPFPGAKVLDKSNGDDAMNVPGGDYDYIFSSHCLEHIENPVAALEHWKGKLKSGGILYLYLPHPDMEYWLPQNNKKHLHSWHPEEMAKLLRDLGFISVMNSERDMYWSFSVVGTVSGNDTNSGFENFVTTNRELIEGDEQLRSIMGHFGIDAFRRSCVLENFDKFLKDNNFRGGRCVEIGTYNGLTALVLARHFREVVSIDNLPNTMKHAVLKHTGVKNIKFIDIKSNTEKADIINSLDFDAAFVDGDHENDTQFDFNLVEKCGRVLFHEYWEKQPKVFELVNSLKKINRVVIDNKLALWTR
jgi:SAM-dependent methyltransferase